MNRPEPETPGLLRHDFPVAKFGRIIPLGDVSLTPAEYSEVVTFTLGGELDTETRRKVLFHAAAVARILFRLHDKKRLIETGIPDTLAESLTRGEFLDIEGLPSRAGADPITTLAIDTAQRSVPFNDDAFLQIIQQHVFRLGSRWQTRAVLAEFLHPYQTNAQPVPTLEDRRTLVLNAHDPAAFVRNAVRERLRLIDQQKPFQAKGQDVWQLSAIDELTLNQSHGTSLRWAVSVDWGEISQYLDKRTAQVLNQVLSGCTVEEIGKTAYNRFRLQLPRIRKVALEIQRATPH